MTERRLQDAKIVVKVDTEAAERELEKFDRERGRSRDRDEKRRERSEQRRERGGGRGRDALVAGAVAGRGGAFPGAGVLLLALKTFVVKEIAVQTSAFLAGVSREVGDALPEPVERQFDALADKLELFSERIESIEKQIGAGIGAIGDATDLARSQKLLTGDVDTDAVAAFLLTRAQTRQIEAAFGAQRDTVSRTVRGEIAADVVGDIADTIADELGRMFSGAGAQQ